MFEPDHTAKVVIDEASGVIVMGDDVRVSTVAIAQGSLTVSISETPQVSQPSPFSDRGRTVVVPRTSGGGRRSRRRSSGSLKAGFACVRSGRRSQRSWRAAKRDMIAILQAIKAAGALQADIEVLCNGKPRC